ncbi:MAG: bifunctional 4-hydroxy-3-methylbut-2-enyl diphosphate reductase/30S ribosomal protein S1 [Clostridia bacterium]|nr:bifunctional 4-hydroxy-3-methylbut-2-enyl diphosphate reductase/30S ribosomal protein S1 [Clostridia bacterium]
MELTVASHVGFCFGVRRAVAEAEKLLDAGKTVRTLGPVIHNPQIVESLAARGARVVSSPEEVEPGATALIRAHGVGRAVIEALEARGVEVADATCPFVKRIHALADEAAASGMRVLVVGAKDHPEVRGILGWARGRGLAIETEEEAEAAPGGGKALVVAQTTVTPERFERVCAVLKRRGMDLDIRNTICQTTPVRQREAVEIAQKVDVMLVIGGKNSSNTRRLYELCRAICPRTYLAETAREIQNIKISPRDHIGITAGASTPDGTFKEVVARMNDIKNQEQEELQQETVAEPDFAAEYEKTLVQLRPGQTVTGKVVQITEDEVCVNVGYKADGLVKKSDLSTPDVKIDDEIEVEVVKVNDGEGNVLLSQRNIVNRKVWDAIVAAYESGEIVKGVGKESVKGGLIADVMGIRAFIPASLLSLRYVEKIDEFVGQEMDLKIIEIDKSKKRVVASRKAVLQAEEEAKKAEAWEKLAEGEIVKGIVRRLTTFGAFVDIGGVDGLVHVSDLAWKRVGHPSEVVSVGQEIDVKIIKLDKERDRISLSYKATQPKLWDIAGEKYIPGTVVSGKVVRIVPYGAFVELEPGLDGMVHISQCAPTRIEKVEDAVNVGDEIRVKILSVDTEAKRISLSIKEALADDALESVSEDEFAIPEAPEAAEAPEAPEA